MGTTLAVGGKPGCWMKKGNMANINRCVMVDSIAAAIGPWWYSAPRR